MARTLSDILRRFRPAAAPGPAAPAGVPADRLAESEAELAPVLAALEGVLADAERVRTQAHADAEARRRDGADQADRIVGDARSRLGSVRAEAASQALASLDEQRDALAQHADEEVARLQRAAAEHQDEVVAAVLGRVWQAAGLTAPEGAS